MTSSYRLDNSQTPTFHLFRWNGLSPYVQLLVLHILELLNLHQMCMRGDELLSDSEKLCQSLSLHLQLLLRMLLHELVPAGGSTHGALARLTCSTWYFCYTFAEPAIAVYASCVCAEPASSTPFSTRKKWEIVWNSFDLFQISPPIISRQERAPLFSGKMESAVLGSRHSYISNLITVTPFSFSLFLTPSWKCIYIFWGTSVKIAQG